MIDFSKLLRWALPGAAAIAWLLGSLQFQRLLSFSRYALRPVITTGGGAAVAAVASIPLGFLLYQLYSYRFNNPIPLLQVVHKDAARRTLIQIGQAPQIASGYEDRRVDGVRIGRRIFFSSAWLRIRTYWLWDDQNRVWLEAPDSRTKNMVKRQFYRAREKNWVEVEWALTRYKPHTDVDVSRAFVEIDRLSEIYHTLGATRAGIVFSTALAALVGAGINVAAGKTANWWGSGVGWVITTIVALYLYKLIQDNRAHALDRRSAILGHLLKALARP